MLIACASDIHEQYNFTLPSADLLVLAGDLTGTGTENQLNRFNDWLGQIKNQFPLGIVGCAGNHDWLYYRDRKRAEEIVTHMTYVEDAEITIEGVKFYFSPYSPSFLRWAFMADRGERIRRRWAAVPERVDVLVTHSPPANILDYGLGCADLYDEVVNRIKPKAHIFGHIHEGYGKTKLHDIEFLNASVCDGAYRPVNPVQLVEVV